VDECKPLILGSSAEEDDVHVLTFTAWPQSVYTVQLHGALSATMVGRCRLTLSNLR